MMRDTMSGTRPIVSRGTARKLGSAPLRIRHFAIATLPSQSAFHIRGVVPKPMSDAEQPLLSNGGARSAAPLREAYKLTPQNPDPGVF